MTENVPQAESEWSLNTSYVSKEDSSAAHHHGQPHARAESHGKGSDVQELSIDFMKLSMMNASEAIKHIEASVKASMRKHSEFSPALPQDKSQDDALSGISLAENFAKIKERTDGRHPSGPAGCKPQAE